MWQVASRTVWKGEEGNGTEARQSQMVQNWLTPAVKKRWFHRFAVFFWVLFSICSTCLFFSIFCAQAGALGPGFWVLFQFVNSRRERGKYQATIEKERDGVKENTSFRILCRYPFFSPARLLQQKRCYWTLWTIKKGATTTWWRWRPLFIYFFYFWFKWMSYLHARMRGSKKMPGLQILFSVSVLFYFKIH